MNATIQDRRQPLPTILTVYRPIEEYWSSCGKALALGSDPAQVLDPLDAFLIHRVLTLVPGLPVLVDAAFVETSGASSLIGLAHPQVRGVLAVANREFAPAERALSTVRSWVHDQGRGPGVAPLEVIARSEVAASLAERPRAVILVDARRGDIADLTDEVRAWIDAAPDALVLVLGVGCGCGRREQSGALASWLRLCEPSSGKQFRLLRDCAEVLAASRLGVVARHDHPDVADVLLRIQQSYTGNNRFLDLLRRVDQEGLSTAGPGAGAVKQRPLTWAITPEMDALKRAVEESCAQARAAARDLANITAKQDELRWELQLLAERHAAAHAAAVAAAAAAAANRGGFPGLLIKVRRRLSPGILGRTWRLAKRVVRRC